MFATQPSRTAEATAFQRATERLRPPRERVLDDPWAEHFLRPGERAALAAYRASRLVKRADEILGLTPFVVLRHRYIDDRLREALAAGARQVVLLGAGYDSRAFRFADLLAGRPVFEVDHPATQQRKQRILRGLARAAPLPAVDVRRVAVDFERDSLEERLAAAGLARRRTFFAWEGVSMYLTRDAVKETLASLRRLAPRGSRLAFDAWFLLDDPDLRSTWHRFSANLLSLLGEPVTFSLHPEDAGDFLAREGFALRDVARAADLERRYPVRGRRRHVYPACYLVSAEIA
ncbi:MAG: SAM-dependent methyltransferase [Proteobacteria bacterium]|nr:MAG: SAM-dependent methyltransferase [Pseudomonadota bacterium]